MPLMKKGVTYSFHALKKRVSIVISFFRFENSRSFMIPSGIGPVGKSLFSSGSGWMFMDEMVSTGNKIIKKVNTQRCRYYMAEILPIRRKSLFNQSINK